MRRPLIKGLSRVLLAVAAGASPCRGGSAPGPAPAGNSIVLRPGVLHRDLHGLAKPAGKAPARLSAQEREAGLEGMEPGSIFVSQGRAYRVEGTRASARGLETVLSEPALKDVVEAIQLHGTLPLGTRHIRREGLAPTRSVAAREQDGTLVFTLQDFVLADLDGDPSTTWDQIRASGTITLEKPRLSFDVDWHFFAPPTVSLEFHTGESCQLSLVTPEGSFDKHCEAPVATFQIPLPGTGGAATLEGALRLHLEASGQVSAQFSFEQHVRLDAGLRNEEGSWDLKPFAQVDAQAQAGPASLDAELHLGAAVAPGLSLQVLQYPIAGVEARLGVSADAHGVATQESQCVKVQVNGEIEARGHVDLPFYSIEREIYKSFDILKTTEFCR